MPDTAPETELRHRIESTHTELANFRMATRNEILRQHFAPSPGWCVSGTQEVLDELGLPPMSKNFTGDVYVRIVIESVNGADDIDEARARVISGLEVTCSDPDVRITVGPTDPVLDEHVQPDPSDEATRTAT